MKNNPIPPDQPTWNVYSKLADENKQFLWGLLEEAADPGRARNASEEKIGDYFQACMDEPAIEKLGAAPLQMALGEIAALKSKSELGKYLGHHIWLRYSAVPLMWMLEESTGWSFGLAPTRTLRMQGSDRLC